MTVVPKIMNKLSFQNCGYLYRLIGQQAILINIVITTDYVINTSHQKVLRITNNINLYSLQCHQLIHSRKNPSVLHAWQLHNLLTEPTRSL